MGEYKYLFGWVHQQRNKYEKLIGGEQSAMTEDRVQTLNEKHSTQDIWNKWNGKLLHIRNDLPDDMRTEKVSKLNKIGFVWAPHAELQMSRSKESKFIPPKSCTSFLFLTNCKNSKNMNSPKTSISPNASFQREKGSFTNQNYKQDIWYEQYMELVKHK
eukprot:12966397-Ditylum_brightwellii.AAC.1